MKVCAACGEENPARARRCMICGAALPERIALGEERKLITVLFCDLVGFTSRSEQMDIEDVRGTLGPYHDLLRGELERHGGTVEKFIGDAVMALFGAPRARDRDAERAVRAALAIQAAIAELRAAEARLDLHVRIGVNTGEAVVKLDASPISGEGMAFGDPVNVAARLQSAAPVDGVLVGEETYQLTREVIDYEPSEPINAKGKRAPVEAWRALRPRDGDPRMPPLVGRAAELRRLEAAIPRPGQSEPRVTALLGDAGSGKSRLKRALRTRASSLVGAGGWHQAAAPEIPSAPLAPFADILRSVLDIAEATSPDDARTRLGEALGRLIDEDVARAWVEREVGVLLGVVEVPEAGDRQVEARAAWARLVASAARERPQVLVFDDLHWADDALVDLLGDLRRRLHGLPISILLAGRLDVSDRLAAASLDAERIVLSPLTDDDALDLLAATLSTPLAGVRGSEVVQRARGNPLFLCEYAHLLETQPLAPDAQLVIPHSVRAVISARLDALPVELKTVSHVAAVLGETIVAASVAACSERPPAPVQEHLDELAARRVLEPPAVSGASYRFQHDLFREVAYATLPRARRADLHVRAGDWLAQAGRDDRADLLAYHYMAALELRRAANQPTSDLTAKAQRASHGAGDAAYAVNAFAVATAHYQAARALAREASPADEPGLLLALGRARYHIQDALPEELPAASRGLRDIGDRDGAAEAEMLMGLWLGNHGRMAEGLAHSRAAQSLLSGTPPSRLRAEVAISLGERAVLSGDIDAGGSARRCRRSARSTRRALR